MELCLKARDDTRLARNEEDAQKMHSLFASLLSLRAEMLSLSEVSGMDNLHYEGEKEEGEEEKKNKEEMKDDGATKSSKLVRKEKSIVHIPTLCSRINTFVSEGRFLMTLMDLFASLHDWSSEAFLFTREEEEEGDTHSESLLVQERKASSLGPNDAQTMAMLPRVASTIHVLQNHVTSSLPHFPTTHALHQSSNAIKHLMKIASNLVDILQACSLIFPKEGKSPLPLFMTTFASLQASMQDLKIIHFVEGESNLEAESHHLLSMLKARLQVVYEQVYQKLSLFALEKVLLSYSLTLVDFFLNDDLFMNN
jgi:hypothetical protein